MGNRLNIFPLEWDDFHQNFALVKGRKYLVWRRVALAHILLRIFWISYYLYICIFLPRHALRKLALGIFVATANFVSLTIQVLSLIEPLSMNSQ